MHYISTFFLSVYSSQHNAEGVHIISMTSIQHPGALRRREGVVQGVELAVRFIVEPFGSTCRLNVITRQDLRLVSLPGLIMAMMPIHCNLTPPADSVQLLQNACDETIDMPSLSFPLISLNVLQ